MNAFRVEEVCQLNPGCLPSLEGAQKRLKPTTTSAKQVFEYDEVMNNQRRAIYAERRRVLEGQDLKNR